MSPPNEWVRDWHSWEDYKSVHDNHLRRHPFVVEGNLTWFEVNDPSGNLEAAILAGTIQCHGGVVVRVEKRLRAQRDGHGRTVVLGDSYAYQAFIPGQGGILRYDNAHTDTPEEFHCHEYDLATGEEKPRRLLSRAEMPRLSAFLDEVATKMGFGM